jgi:hypothetical protein
MHKKESAANSQGADGNPPGGEPEPGSHSMRRRPRQRGYSGS